MRSILDNEVDSRSNDKCPCKRQEETQREERPREDGGTDGGTRPQAKGSLEPLEAERGRKICPLEPPKGTQPLDLRLLFSRTREKSALLS